MKKVTVRLTETEYKKLSSRAKNTRTSMNDVVRAGVKLMLSDSKNDAMLEITKFEKDGNSDAHTQQFVMKAFIELLILSRGIASETVNEEFALKAHEEAKRNFEKAFGGIL